MEMVRPHHDDLCRVVFVGEDEERHGHRGAAAAHSDRDDDDVFLSLSCGSPSSSSGEAAGNKLKLRRRRNSSRRCRRRGQHPEFACRTCGRAFATFQALGGHRTSHLRRRPTAATRLKRVVGHACATCGLGFSTGQALGGHMRKHRWTAIAIQDPAADLNLTQIIVRDRPSSSASSLQLLQLFL